MHAVQPGSWKRHVIALLIFGTAFGYLEAAVVSYLRLLHEPVRQRFYPGRSAGELFPLLTQEQIAVGGPEQHKVLVTEVGREVATIVMLAGIALAVAENTAQWAAAFVITFGTWDITFYLFLKTLLNWPASPFTWDILFIIPVPWVSPVLAPVVVSAAMIGAGVWHLRRESTHNPVRLGRWNWAGIVVGAATIIVSFTFDYRCRSSFLLTHTVTTSGQDLEFAPGSDFCFRVSGKGEEPATSLSGGGSNCVAESARLLCSVYCE
jgi:hypothetical protein